MAKIFRSAWKTEDAYDCWYYLPYSQEIVVYYKQYLGLLDPTLETIKNEYPRKVIKLAEIEKVVQLPNPHPGTLDAVEYFAVKISDSNIGGYGGTHYITCKDTKLRNALLDKMLFD